VPEASAATIASTDNFQRIVPSRLASMPDWR